MIDTSGPGPLWGAGGAPAGPPDITLVSTNTVVEDGNRAGNDATGGSPAGGELYYARLTNPAHDPCECGPGIGPVLSIIGFEQVNWAAQVYDGRLDTDCPTAGGPTLTGYVTITQSGAFTFGFTANYCNACGPIATDEQFTCELWGPL